MLKKFLLEKMSMSHIYQPVMIKTLLLNNGNAPKSTIAKAILSHDSSQVEYYEKITVNMVGKVLRDHSIVQKDKNNFTLNEYKELSNCQIEELIEICDQKIQNYIDQRGIKIWEHRRKNRKPIKGSVRYEVLKRANGRCELCGIDKEERALEVDHILPKNFGGEDSINNYQALCFKCNANKRDKDSTDFRELDKFYNYNNVNCIFCTKQSNSTILENNLAKAFYDNYPVTDNHILIVPKRHCDDYFSLSQPEINAIHNLTHELKELLLKQDKSIEGFNLGFNCGETAGQTIFHCHMHLIPRRKNDVDNPLGGLRNLIPGKGNYLSN